MSEQQIYTARATATGGRTGHARSDDGRVDVDLSIPEAMGGPGGPGTNPEQLFAAGHAACWQSALFASAEKRSIDVSGSEVTIEVDIGPPTFTLAVRIFARMPGVDRDTAEKLAAAADALCPYSRATRGNIERSVTVVD